MSIEISSPGVVKFGGEHRIVYGGISLAAAIDLRAKVSFSSGNSNKFSIKLPDIDDSVYEFDRNYINDIWERYKKRDSLQDFVKSTDILPSVLPYVVIASRASSESGIDVIGKAVSITSHIPLQSGCASSSACYTGFTVGLLGKRIDELGDLTAIDIARDGERIGTMSEGAGKIDVSTSYHGGYVSVGREVKREVASKPVKLLLINTGPKKSTKETVGAVRQLYEKDKEYVEGIFAQIDSCTYGQIEALKNGDLQTLGSYMTKNHSLLRDLGVSTPRLDDVVRIANQNGAYGAKLSGGGGGGVAIAATDDPQALARVFKDFGFESFQTSVTKIGARDQI